MLNHIDIMGRLVRDPELRRFNETPVCTIRIACDRDYRNANGEREADFFDVVTWRKLAEIVSQYAAKGRMVSVGGRLQLRPWQDNEGKKRYFPEIVAEHVYFCDPKPKDQNAQNGGAASNADAQSGGYAQGSGYGADGYGRGSGYGGGYNAQPSGNGGYSARNPDVNAQGFGNGGGYGQPSGNGGYNAQNPGVNAQGSGNGGGYSQPSGYGGNNSAYANNGDAAYSNGAPANADAYAAPPSGFVPNFDEENGDLPF